MGPFRATTAIAKCEQNCFEPTVAVGADGVIYVATAWGDLAASEAGGSTFEPRRAPPPPDGAAPDAALADAMLVSAPDGAIYFVAILSPRAAFMSTLLGIQSPAPTMARGRGR